MAISVPARQGRALGVTALLGTALLVAACGSSSSSSPPGSATSPSTPAAPSTPATSAAAPTPTASPATAGCASSGLKIKVDTSQGGAAAGSVYVPIDFTNITGSTCTLFGYPGVSFVTSPSGSELGRAATRNPPTGTLVTLAPGGVAHAVLRVAEAGNYDASACVPVTAHWLRVYPPNQFTAIYARYKTTACSARLPAKLGSQVSVYVVRPGPGQAGQAP
jgi:hypothetical protein